MLTITLNISLSLCRKIFCAAALLAPQLSCAQDSGIAQIVAKLECPHADSVVYLDAVAKSINGCHDDYSGCISIYPGCAHDWLVAEGTDATNISLFDIDNKTYYLGKLEAPDFLLIADVRQIPRGEYFVSASMGYGLYIEKIIIY